MRQPSSRATLLSAAIGVLSLPPALHAQDFEKVGSPLPISPTGLSWTAPAAARAAGWTIAVPEASTTWAALNPALSGSAGRWELVVEAAYQNQDFASPDAFSLDAHDVRLSTLAARVQLSKVCFGVEYQRPFHAEHELVILRPPSTTIDDALDVWTGSATIAVRPATRLGASFAVLDVGRGDDDRWAYQAGLGAEHELHGVVLAAAFHSEPFGQDRDRLLAPSWLQLDVRAPLASAWTLGGRLGGGWWNDTRSGRLRSPIDAGLGASWQAVAALRVLAGVHHLRERIDCGTASVPCPDELARDQGTFLDAGLFLQLARSHAALAVEDSHVFGATAPSTHVTVSVAVGR